MSDLISRCALFNRLATVQTLGEAYGVIQGMDTVDAVPVVRCKDCKHWKHFRGGLGNCKHPKFVEPLTENYHFCGYGERKDGGNGSID